MGNRMLGGLLVMLWLAVGCGDDAAGSGTGGGRGGASGEGGGQGDGGAKGEGGANADGGANGDGGDAGAPAPSSTDATAAQSSGAGGIPESRPELVDYVCQHLADCRNDGWSSALLTACHDFLGATRADACRDAAVTSYLSCLAPIDCTGDDFAARDACEEAYRSDTAGCALVTDMPAPSEFCSANATVCGDSQGEVDECQQGCDESGFASESCAYGYCMAVAEMCDGSKGGEVLWLCVEERGLLD